MSQSVSDKVTYWAVGWTAKNTAFILSLQKKIELGGIRGRFDKIPHFPLVCSSFLLRKGLFSIDIVSVELSANLNYHWWCAFWWSRFGGRFKTHFFKMFISIIIKWLSYQPNWKKPTCFFCVRMLVWLKQYLGNVCVVDKM